MGAVQARAYTSPTLVLLAMDWPDGVNRPDFLGFAIERTPGFQDLTTGTFAPSSWLPNRINFNGPPAPGQPDFPSNEAPIQKFMWWDARLEGLAPDTPVKYAVSAVTGAFDNPQVDQTSTTSLTVTLPAHVEYGIGTWFNRAVMSSQAFSRKLKALGIIGTADPTPAQALELRKWLANGMESPVPELIGAASSIVGAIYHLTDNLWIIPALQQDMGGTKIALVYDSNVTKDSHTHQPLPNPNEGAIQTLSEVDFYGRDKTNIMHNKYLVSGTNVAGNSNQQPRCLTTGSANYTTEGLTSQANLIHTFESPELAELYLERFNLLSGNPTLGKTAKEAGWSKTFSVGDCGIRVFFSPEPGKPGEDASQSIETVVQSVHSARSSVLFCLFMPTDKDLRDACFAAGDAGKMMFGLVNNIVEEAPILAPTATGKIPADQLASLEIFHRSQDNGDVIDAAYFHGTSVPEGFELELNIFPGEKRPPYPPVIIHHKFVVIDAETDSPIIYTGSANMSGNSVFKNDENLLEIKGSSRLARIYLSEFMRLYEHYRARARYIKFKKSATTATDTGFALAKDQSWAKRHYTPDTPEYKARVRMLGVS